MRVLAITALAACSGPSAERSYTLEELPVHEWTAGLPVSGDGRLVVSRSLIAPSDWSTINGYAVFTCDGCTLGDDRTRLRIPNWGGEDAIDFSHIICS